MKWENIVEEVVAVSVVHAVVAVEGGDMSDCALLENDKTTNPWKHGNTEHEPERVTEKYLNLIGDAAP